MSQSPFTTGPAPGDTSGQPGRRQHTPPPAGWTPPPLVGRQSGQSGRRPTDPFGDPPVQPVRIEDFAPPRSRVPMFVTLAVLAALALVLLGGTLRAYLPVPPASSPTPTVATPSALPGLPFTTPDERARGRWEILDHRWTASGLMVEVRIHVDHGPLGYSFMAFENQGTEVIEPSPGADSPALTGSSIPTGGVETGWVYFLMTRGDATIILANEEGRQMSALVVEG